MGSQNGFDHHCQVALTASRQSQSPPLNNRAPHLLELLLQLVHVDLSGQNNTSTLPKEYKDQAVAQKHASQNGASETLRNPSSLNLSHNKPLVDS